jgi:hypothetical protein
MAALERYFVDMRSVRDCVRLYSAEDKIRGAMQLLLDIQDMTYNEYEQYDDRLRKTVWELEKEKGF